MRQPLQRGYKRAIAFGFRLLYNELALFYDAVSWMASLGRWRDWQNTPWPYLPKEGQLLEVAFGPGHLLADFAAAGLRTVGVELSSSMIRIAQRRVQRSAWSIPLCQGDATALPFAPTTFDAVVVTFPAAFICEAVWLRQAARVLKRGGRLIVVEKATLGEGIHFASELEWLYRLTGQRGQRADLVHLLNDTGFSASRQAAVVRGTEVSIVVALRKPEVGSAEPPSRF